MDYCSYRSGQIGKSPDSTHAYRCLSNEEKRAVFNADRSKISCKVCSQKSRELNGSCTSSNFQKVVPGQKFSKSWKPSVDSETKSDDEKLQLFRERARARVDSSVNAWKERRTKLKEEFQVMYTEFQCNSVERKEWTRYERRECQYPSYSHRRVQVETEANLDIPIFSASEDMRPQYAHARNVPSSEATSHLREEKLETSNHRKPLGRFAWIDHGKQIPFSEPKDLEEILRNEQACSRNPSKASKNLKSLLQKAKGESRNNSQYQGSNMWRSSKMQDYGNSTASCLKYSKTSQSDNENRNARKSEELLKTLERLRIEAKSVAATLEKLKQGVAGRGGGQESKQHTEKEKHLLYSILNFKMCHLI
eukprot:Gb_34510 [translate_table: standard]